MLVPVNFDITQNNSTLLNITADASTLIPNKINELHVKDNLFMSQQPIEPAQSEVPPMGSLFQYGTTLSFQEALE